MIRYFRFILSIIVISIVFLCCAKSHSQNTYRLVIDSLLYVYENASNDSLKSNVSRQLCANYAPKSPDSARIFGNKGIEYAEKHGGAFLIGKAYQQSSWLSYNQGKCASAIKDSKIAQNYFNLADSIKHFISAGTDMGLYYWCEGKLDTSIIQNLKILNLADSLDYRETKPIILLHNGLVYSELDQNDKAKAALLEAIPLAEKYNIRKLAALCCNNLANIYMDDKQYKEAVAMSRKSIELAKKDNFHIQITRGYINLGYAYRELNQLDSALMFLNLAEESCHEGRYMPELIKTRLNLSRLHQVNKDYHQAKSYAQKALDISKKSNKINEFVHIYNRFFSINKELGNHDLAYTYLDSVHLWKDSIASLKHHALVTDAEVRHNTSLIAADNFKKETQLKEVIQKKKLNLLLFVLATTLLILCFSFYTYRLKRKKSNALLKIEKTYAQANISNTEKIKQEIAGRLHDDIGQDLILAKQAIRTELNPKVGEELIDHAIQKIRRLSQDEYPHMIEILGLKASLENIIDRVEMSTSLIVSESLDTLPEYVSKENVVHIYRIIQECLNNTIKHASAKSVFIGVKRYNKEVEIRYSDNGRSFSFKENLKKGKSLGLKHISDRLNLMKADIRSLPNNTNENTLCFRIPISIN